MKKLNFIIILSIVFLSIIEAKIKIMPLGDSITWDWYYGDSRSDSQRHGYRNYLWYKLKNAGYDIDFVGTRHNGSAVEPEYDGDNEGYSGYTTYQISNIIYSKLESTSPDIILLHIGTNDSLYYSPYDMTGLESILNKIDLYEKNYKKHITVILARIIPFPRMGSFVSIFNKSIDKMAKNRIENGDDIVVVNMEVVSSLIDGIHPTDSGYKQMADIWFDGLQKPLKEFNNNSFLIPINVLLLQ